MRSSFLRKGREFLGVAGLAAMLSYTPMQKPIQPQPSSEPVVEAYVTPEPRMTREYGDSLLKANMTDLRRLTKVTQPRDTTLFVIYHGTEHGPNGSCKGDENVLVNSGRSPKAHLLVCADGRIKNLQSDSLWVNGAGTSMFNGLDSLSNYAFQVEFETITYREGITPIQEDIGCALSLWAKDRYNLNDSAFVSHGQVAYDEYAGEKVRERKRDGFFDFDRLCVYNRIVGDPDAEAGRLKASPFQTRLYELERKDSLTAVERLNLVYNFPSVTIDGMEGFMLWGDITPFVINAWNYGQASAKYLIPREARPWVTGADIAACSRSKTCTGVQWGRIPEGTIMFPVVSERRYATLRRGLPTLVAQQLVQDYPLVASR